MNRANFFSLDFLQASLAMEALVERLEQAVIRLETFSAKLQGCSGSLSNGEINTFNGTVMSVHAYIQLQNIVVSVCI